MVDMWWPRIRAAAGLRKVVSIRKGYGSEAYLFANGSMIMLASGTQTSDHGDTLHMAVIDEAWAQRDETIERSEEHTSELQSPDHLVCRLLLEKKKATRSSRT